MHKSQKWRYGEHAAGIDPNVIVPHLDEVTFDRHHHPKKVALSLKHTRKHFSVMANNYFQSRESIKGTAAE
jgi:hypothetical protein